MPAKYVLTRRGDSFHWNLLATNGKVVATSETYNTKRAALAGIESLRKNAAGAALDDQTAAGSAKAATSTASEAPAAAGTRAKKAGPKAVGESAPARKPTSGAAKAAKVVPARKPPAKRSASPRRSGSDIS